MELNFKFNPFNYVAIKRTSSKMRKTCLELCEASVFEISSGCMYVHPEYRNSVGQQQGGGRLLKGHHGDLFVSDPCFQPDEGHRSRHRACGCVQCIFQDAERRPGREEDHHAHHRWLCGFHRHVGGASALLQVTNRWEPDHLTMRLAPAKFQHSMEDFFPIYKGIQKPLEFMGIRGRFLTFAAIAIGVSFLGFILFSIILGKLAGFIAMIVLALVGLATIYIRQRNGLHAKHHDKGICIYHGIFKQ